jgi:hypothetical protein
MSYDPSSPEGLPPDRPEPGVPYERPEGDVGAARSHEAVRGRVQMPAIFLIVVAILNLLLALGCFGFAVVYSRIPEDQAEEIEKMMQKDEWQKKNLEEMKKAGYTMQDILKMYVYGGFGGGAVGLVTSLLILLGGIQMLRLRSYGLAVFSSILVALPCISGSACCCLGEGIGIWALVVLMNPEVRAAFAAMR